MGGDDEIGCSDMHGHKMLDSSHDAVTSVRELGRRPFRVAYDDGEGPDYHVKDPVVLLMAGAAASSDFWKPVVDRLQHVDVITYDRPGLGGTIWPGRYPELDEEVASLTDLVGLVQGIGTLGSHGRLFLLPIPWRPSMPRRLLGCIPRLWQGSSSLIPL
ncbi:hypothetical protein TPCU411_15440 [Cutibacterium acnes]|nr:hypothetical protein TPCU411_15440 [Cutibacterium acnes]